MLKVKKKIPSTKNKNQNEDVTQLLEEIENSLKNLYLSDQKNKKTKFNYKNIKTTLKIYLRNHIRNIKNR